MAESPTPAGGDAGESPPPPGGPTDNPRSTATGRLRAAAATPVRHVLSAYSGEHGVYGIVLVTALIAVGWDDDTDLDVLLFVLCTVFVFWLAHIYAAVVASRGRKEPLPLRTAMAGGIRHTNGMLLAMLIPVFLLSLGVFHVLDEWTAYYLALASGVVMLALIGYANAARNGSDWRWRIAGVFSTTLLGLFVIALSIVVH